MAIILVSKGRLIYTTALFRGVQIGGNAKFLLPLIYEKGHQEIDPGGHSFVFLNVSINNKAIFFSEVVINKKDSHFPGSRIVIHSFLHYRSHESQVPLEPAISRS